MTDKWDVCTKDPDTDPGCCNQIYNEYNGQNPMLSMGLGVASGLGGMVGLSGFWDTTNSDSADSINADFANVKSSWNDLVQSDEFNLNQDIQKYNETQFSYVENMQEEMNTILSEKIAIDELLITIIGVILMIILIYLLVI